MAKMGSGIFLLRIEDIDASRARAHWEAQIFDDLKWLGLSWPTPVVRQSDNLKRYSSALDTLWNSGLLFRCDCNRRDISEATRAPQEGAQNFGPDGIIYPGTCRQKHPRTGSRPDRCVLRLDIERALAQTDQGLIYEETGLSPGTVSVRDRDPVRTLGDVVLARRDMGTSYHLSVVADDAAQNVTHVVRGADLAEATDIHVILQELLGLRTPTYHHHKLIRDEQGKRLAKRSDSRAIRRYRDEGATPADIRAMVGLPPD